MAKPVIKFKTYRQSAAVGGKIYGVPYLGDTIVADVTMQEVIDYAKLHNYSADTLSALLSQVIAGVGDLVARDGRPRMLSDLLKFEPVIKGTFNNMEQTVTTQKVLVRPRMLKEIKVALDPSAYSWQNQNDKESPRLISVAPVSALFDSVTRESLIASLADGGSGFGWTYAGNRLCPNGWRDSSFSVLLPYEQDGNMIDVHLELYRDGDNVFGSYDHGDADRATDNVVAFSRFVAAQGQSLQGKAWYPSEDASLPPNPLADEDLTALLQTVPYVKFLFTRQTAAGDSFTVEKTYTL